jgi:NAD-dependent dihydropyrimidine dehydrogenase PreA subunit
MTHVIAEPCIGVKDSACADVCTVDCIHGGDQDPQLFINPTECIDCILCVEACPVFACYAAEDLPEYWTHYLETNAAYFEAAKPA